MTMEGEQIWREQWEKWSGWAELNRTGEQIVGNDNGR